MGTSFHVGGKNHRKTPANRSGRRRQYSGSCLRRGSRRRGRKERGQGRFSRRRSDEEDHPDEEPGGLRRSPGRALDSRRARQRRRRRRRLLEGGSERQGMGKAAKTAGNRQRE